MQQPENRPAHASNPLVLGAWFALIAGLGDFVLFFVTSAVLHRFVRLSPELIWISPLSNIILFAVPGLILWALARRRPASYWTFASVAVFVFLGAWGLSTYATRLHPAAAVVLALGIAVQTARVITAHPGRTRKLIRYTLPAMALVSTIGGLGLNSWDRFNERRSIAALPSATQGSPNILLVILDTVRAASLSLHGYSRQTTPSLDEFAKRGVAFDAAISASPWTLPSHATIFTGRWPHELKADWRVQLSTEYPTLAEVLAENGYATAGFVANRFNAGRQSGLARGFHHYDDVRYSRGRFVFSSALGRYLLDRTPLPRWLEYHDQVGRKRARDVNAEVLDWLAEHKSDGRPFFAFLNYYDAHDPYIAPPPFNTLFDKQLVPLHPGMQLDSLVTRADIVSETAAYDESVAALDHQLGLLLTELEGRGDLRNTIVVISSDHGEELGEHGFLRHGKTLYIQGLHVPLVIAFDGRVPSGARVGTPVTLRDLPATIIDLAQVANQSATAAPALSGRSLARFWTTSGQSSIDTLISEVRSRPNRPRREPTSRGDMASIVNSTRHLILNADGATEMYRIDVDPLEQHNLAARPEIRDAVHGLSATLRAIVPLTVRR